MLCLVLPLLLRRVLVLSVARLHALVAGLRLRLRVALLRAVFTALVRVAQLRTRFTALQAVRLLNRLHAVQVRLFAVVGACFVSQRSNQRQRQPRQSLTAWTLPKHKP
jgi:hypothetical protein